MHSGIDQSLMTHVDVNQAVLRLNADARREWMVLSMACCHSASLLCAELFKDVLRGVI